MSAIDFSPAIQRILGAASKRAEPESTNEVRSILGCDDRAERGSRAVQANQHCIGLQHERGVRPIVSHWEVENSMFVNRGLEVGIAFDREPLLHWRQ